MNIKKILVLTLFLVAIVGIIAPINATNTQNIDKTVLSKEKATKYKITWNANGGKIGAKKTVTTTVTKGSKIGKVTTPKRYSYSFTGWYTAKSGGKKITSTTKMPARNLNLYAHWKKASSNSVIKSKIVGEWKYNSVFQYYYNFDSKGKFTYVYTGGTIASSITGKYSTNNGKIYLNNLVYEYSGVKTNLKNQQYKYSFGKDAKGEFLLTIQFQRDDTAPLTEPVKFRRIS